MKSRPILFSAPMVRALLNGSKTQTRRVAKLTDAAHIKEVGGHRRWHPADPDVVAASPYGKVGDQLWVRETWQGPLLDDDQLETCRQNGIDVFKKPEFCVYRATDKLDAIDDDGKELGWKPSIFMPRWASRITLEITGVRVERLHDITAADALAEGVIQLPDGGYSLPDTRHYSDSPDESYASLWEHLNGEGSWNANPWVWVIEFKKVNP